jgi:hypothetical protein
LFCSIQENYIKLFSAEIPNNLLSTVPLHRQEHFSATMSVTMAPIHQPVDDLKTVVEPVELPQLLEEILNLATEIIVQEVVVSLDLLQLRLKDPPMQDNVNKRATRSRCSFSCMRS